MLGYVCKYTPMELFEAMDTEITRLEPSVTDFNHADTLMHANICSYTKAVLEDVMEHDYEGVILTTCCDSIRRLYDTLKSQFPDKFFFLYSLDSPSLLYVVCAVCTYKTIIAHCAPKSKKPADRVSRFAGWGKRASLVGEAVTAGD